MRIAILKETKFKENRVAITPDVAKDLVNKGFQVMVEAGAGMASFFSNEAYNAVGASVIGDVATLYKDADIVLRVNAPLPDEIAMMNSC